MKKVLYAIPKLDDDVGLVSSFFSIRLTFTLNSSLTYSGVAIIFWTSNSFEYFLFWCIRVIGQN